LATMTATNATQGFIDTDAAKRSHRFYGAVAP
jgi:hypothetical protein